MSDFDLQEAFQRVHDKMDEIKTVTIQTATRLESVMDQADEHSEAIESLQTHKNRLTGGFAVITFLGGIAEYFLHKKG
jgi:hypothetical protein